MSYIRLLLQGLAANSHLSELELDISSCEVYTHTHTHLYHAHKVICRHSGQVYGILYVVYVQLRSTGAQVIQEHIFEAKGICSLDLSDNGTASIDLIFPIILHVVPFISLSLIFFMHVDHFSFPSYLLCFLRI